MSKSRKEIAEQIDERIYGIIEGLNSLSDVCRPEHKHAVYDAACDLKRWALIEWGVVHNAVELGPFCIFREKDDGKKKKT